MFAKKVREDAAVSAKEFVTIVLRRFDEIDLGTDRAIGDAGGPSTSTLTKYRKVRDEGADLAEPRDDVYQRIDTAARWRSGSARGLWRRGEAPVTLEQEEQRVVDELARATAENERLRAENERLRAELERRHSG